MLTFVLLRRYFVSLLLTFAISFSGAWAQEPSGLTFYVIGDIPYNKSEARYLENQIETLPDDGAFLVHVGDIKSPGKCEQKTYVEIASTLKNAKMPVFVLPGDNEWNDCKKPAKAWRFWLGSFAEFDKNWAHEFPVVRDENYPGNFAFTHAGILVIGLNIVGGKVHSKKEWRKRLVSDARWVKSNIDTQSDQISGVVVLGHAGPGEKHRNFFDIFDKIGQETDKPILYLHGDGHRWVKDRPFIAQNILRVQIDGGDTPAVKVSVTAATDQPFEVTR